MRFIYTKGFAIFFGALILATAATYFHYKGWLDGVQAAVLHVPRPLAAGLRKVTQPTKSFFTAAFSLKKIAEDNKRLEQEVFDLKNSLVLFDAYALENEQLRKELQFVKTSKLALQPCTVIGRNPTGIVDTIVINCGSGDGVQSGMAVTSRGYLVGKISYVAGSFSTVQLITNSNFSVDAKLSHSGRLAIARGSFNSGLILDQVSQDEPLASGMLVVTAGVNERLPKNLLIGEVSDVLSGPNDLFKQASLISPIDFGDLEFVFLVK